MAMATGTSTIRRKVKREMTIAAIISPSLSDFQAGSQVSEIIQALCCYLVAKITPPNVYTI